MVVYPILRWAGGKRWLANSIACRLAGFSHNIYYEPFLGGASMFLGAPFGRSYLSDLNSDLINMYQVIKDRPSELKAVLEKLRADRSSYYKARSASPRSQLNRAGRFVYLNRCCFNGLYRLNRKGDFNVPFGGRSHFSVLKGRLIEDLSLKISKAQLKVADFEETVNLAGDRDLIYCDPAYTTEHYNGSFLRYNEKIFSWEDQVRLLSSIRRAVDRGASAVISNAAHESIRRLYHPLIPLVVTRRSNLIGKSGSALSQEYLYVVERSGLLRKKIRQSLAKDQLLIK